jgi:hypothetical protein
MNVNESKTRGLNAKQQKAIEALLQHPTTAKAAKAAGVSQATIFRWLNEPAFAEAYREARQRTFEGAMTALQVASTEAVGALRRILNAEDAPIYVQLQAAKTILELALKAKETLETEDRLRALEEIYNSATAKKGLRG